MAPLLEIADLRTHINLRSGVVHAVDGVTLRVDEGETLGIVGESGCGKTMTALSIMNLLPVGGHIVGGAIRLGGTTISELGHEAMRRIRGNEIGMVFQDPLTSLNPTMTALSIMNLLPVGGHIVGGAIRLGGTTISELGHEAMRRIRGNEIGMVFQDPLTSLNPTMTVGRQIAEAVLLHRPVTKEQAYDRAAEVLDLVGLPRPKERLGEYPHQFSGGMRQRVMIAMALACEPRLLIADEPTTALDVTIQKQILELIDDLRRRLRMSVILVTHDLGVIAGRADRVAVMYAGKIVETTGTGTLFANPRHPYTEALFEALPEKAAETREKLYSIPGAPPDLVHPPEGCRFAPRCRYAADRCREEEPPLAGESFGHDYACFFPVGQDERTGVRPIVATERLHEPSADGSTGGEVQLATEHLVKDFPVTSGALLQRRTGSVSAVADVSFQIRRGETFGLVGESGCGKTTIGRLIVGLEKPTSGAIRFGGTDLVRSRGREYRRQRRQIQYMFQDSYASLDPRMRAGAILQEPLVIQGIGSRSERQKRVAEMLDHVGLPLGAIERYPHEFSGGQRQRLGFARALMLSPDLIVADEPVSALDVSIQAQILNMMRNLQRELGLTYLFISHDLAVVRYVSTQIGVMYLGKLVEIGPADQVYLRSAHPYTKGLLDSAPVADPEVEQAKVRAGVTGELPSAIHPPSGCRFRTRCPLAEEICAEVEPPMRAFPGSDHLAACHFPLQPVLADSAATAVEAP